ncbi:hypothetical protein [Halostreptopolyspora alba]|uniref:hypothetical protein n=1 Tax=Halostreptopolyspora alba TaxID=2487137 RepID=UPI00371D5E39
MPVSIMVLIGVAAVAVLAGVAFVVVDGDQELARFEADHPPLDLPEDRPVTGEDISRMRIPLALWGYHVRAVDEVLSRLATSLRERDERIAELERRHMEPATRAEPPPAGGVSDFGTVPVEDATPPRPRHG